MSSKGFEISPKRVKLDKPTREIVIIGSNIKKVKQDSLGRVYLWLAVNRAGGE